MQKRGWNDEASERLTFRRTEGGYENNPQTQIVFAYMDLNEGR